MSIRELQFRTIDEDVVEVSEGTSRIGVIRRQSSAWRWGTFNRDEEFPEHWVDLIPSPFGKMVGIGEAKTKLLEFLR